VTRSHLHVASQRRDFHHQTARALVERYGLIAVEQLNVKGLASGMLAKAVGDAGLGQFIRILTDKTAEAGRSLVAVKPAGTTQRCSGCGVVVPKILAQRQHRCTACGLVLGRDLNAALNVLHRATGLGWSLQAPTVEVARAVA
jgi:putative transposase